MNKKWIPYPLIAVLLIAILLIRQFQQKQTPAPSPRVNPGDPATTGPVNRNRGFDRRTGFLEYSEHAGCRMQCRKISKAEVEETMREGKINYNKSDLKNARCPRYAVEDITKDDQRVRVIFAQCDEKTVVVTVIDLETDFECHCPGDDDKYKNKQ